MDKIYLNTVVHILSDQNRGYYSPCMCIDRHHRLDCWRSLMYRHRVLNVVCTRSSFTGAPSLNHSICWYRIPYTVYRYGYENTFGRGFPWTEQINLHWWLRWISRGRRWKVIFGLHCASWNSGTSANGAAFLAGSRGVGMVGFGDLWKKKTSQLMQKKRDQTLHGQEDHLLLCPIRILCTNNILSAIVDTDPSWWLGHSHCRCISSYTWQIVSIPYCPCARWLLAVMQPVLGNRNSHCHLRQQCSWMAWSRNGVGPRFDLKHKNWCQNFADSLGLKTSLVNFFNNKIT